MDNIVTTDDNCQTPSNEQSSSDDISSVATENLLPVYEDDQRRMSSMSSTRVPPVEVNNHNSPPNLEITHPYQPDDIENDSFNDEKKIIDEHVQVSYVERSSLRSLNTDISLSRLDACSRRKSTGNVSVSRTNMRISYSINGSLNNRQIKQMSSRQSTVRVNRTPTAATINQGSDQKIIAFKPMVTRISLQNEQPFKMNYKKLHVSVERISVKQKQSS